MTSRLNINNLRSLCKLFLALLYTSSVQADINITRVNFVDGSVTIEPADYTYYTYENTATVSGSVSDPGSFSSVSWQCQSGCSQGGSSGNPAFWQTGTLYLNSGDNVLSITAHHATDSALDEALTIYLYRTIPEGLQLSFPYQLDFDSGPDSLYQRYSANKGANVTHLNQLCYDGGCAKFVPSTEDNSYAGLGGFNFPANTKSVWLGYLINFGPDYVSNLDRRHKHVLIHRGTEDSTDRGMTYIWTTNRVDNTPLDLSIGACKNTDCRYEGDKTRPDGTESFLIGEHLQEWVHIKTLFDLNSHIIRVYITTRDGVLNNRLIAERSLDAVAPADDHWTRISVIGAFIDWGTTQSDGMYWLLDELVISDDESDVNPPIGFVTGAAKPNPPNITEIIFTPQ